MHGAVEGDIGPAFLKNLTLWFACPWTLAVYFAHIGGLGMIAIGVSFLTFARDGRVSALGTGARRSLGLCIVGVLAEFLAVIGHSVGAIEAVILGLRNADVSAVIALDGTYGFQGLSSVLT